MIVGSRGEYPPPYQQHTAPESPKQQKQWRRRSFPKRFIKSHSDRRGGDTQSVPEYETVPSSSQISIEQEWSKLREAQELVRREREALERDRVVHEARVRYELEQLGRDIEKERRRFGRLPHQDEEEDEEEDYGDAWIGGYDGLFANGYHNMDEESECPDYEDEDIEESGFANWETDDDEPESFTDSAYRTYFQQARPRYMYCDFDGGNQSWEEEAPKYCGQPQHSKQKRENMKKAYKAYIDKWNNVSATDPSIPYPSTDLSSASLLESPNIAIDVSLSQDQIIELNTTTFFLLAFNVRPDIKINTAGTPKIELYPRADLDQVRALQKQMKIERIRWHPDSLVKRRADGMVKEAESEGVYRAVDELLEKCKVRLGGR
jgi:hypothetical protein